MHHATNEFVLPFFGKKLKPALPKTLYSSIITLYFKGNFYITFSSSMKNYVALLTSGDICDNRNEQLNHELKN